MSTDINTSTSNASTSTLNVPTLAKRFGLIAMIAVLALLMGGKLTNALSTSPSTGGSGHSSFDTGYGYGNSTTTPTALNDIAVGPGSTAGSIKVTWTNQANNGATITSYTVANPANTVTLCTTTVVGVAGETNSCTWTPTSANYYHGLINVFANYSGGTKVDISTNVSIKVLAAPALTNGDASPGSTPTVGSGTIKVAWTAPTTYADSSSAASGLAVTGYAVFLGTTQVCTAASTATSCTVNDTTAGLTPGASYQFTVEAINAGGYSANSSQTSAVNAVYAPSAPTGVTAAVNYARGTVDVAFTAPASNGGSPLGAYTYLLNGVGSGVTCTATSTSTAGSPKCTIALTDVAPGGSTFVGFITVVAVNGVAVATSQANSNSITANTVAPAPAAVRWSSGTGTTSPVASWSAVADITNNPVLGYSVQLETCTTSSYVTAVCTASGSPVFVAGVGSGTLSYTFAGLAYGKIYSVAVSAVNGSGTGGIGSIEAEDTAAAAATYAFSNLAAGAAPTAATKPIVITSFGNGTLTATITSPKNLNGGTVTSYSAQLVSCAAMNSSCPVGAAKTATVAGTLTWSGLTPNSFYAVILTTSYTQADGTTSSTQSATSPTVSIGTAPTGFDYTPTATGATFSWDALATGEVKTSFTVAAGSTILCTTTGDATSCNATTAQLGALIALGNTTIRIWSTDANGVNSASVPAYSGVISQVAKPDANAAVVYAYGDTNASFVAGTDSVDVSWTKVTGALSYNVIAIGSDGTTVTATTTNTDYVFSAAKLTATTYKYQVSANGPFGNSGYSTAVSYTGAASAPIAPSIVTAGKFAAGSSITHTLYNLSAGLATALTPLVPLTVGNGGVLNFGFTVNLASTGNPVQSVIGTLTVDKSTTEVCTVPVASLTALTGTYYAGMCTFWGVLTGKSYTFSAVLAGALSSSLSDSITVLNTAPSGPVTGLKASDASGAAGAAGTAGTLTKVSWTAPTTTTSNIVGYKVIVLNKYGNAIPCYTTYNGTTPTTAATTTSCYFASAKSSTYSISVIATENVVDNASGYVALSGDISTTPATLTYSTYTVPASPAAPVAALFVYTGVSQGVSISWPAVTDVQGVTSYIVTASSGTLGTCSTANSNTVSGTGTATITITSSTATVDNAVNCVSSVATPVQFSVKAANATGNSISSPWSSAVTPVAVPSAPTSIYFNANTTTAGGTLYWTASAATTSYKIVVLNSASQVVTSYTVVAPATSYVVPATGLTLGVLYTIKMYSINSGGSSSVSADAGTAGPPSNPTVYLIRNSSTAATATLAWVAGASTGGPVTYNVYQTANGLTSVVATGLTTTSYAITSYTPTTTVYSVTEVNAVGANASGPIAGGTTVANTFTGVAVPHGASLYVNGTGVLTTTSVKVGYSLYGTHDAGVAEDTSTALPYSVVVTLTPVGGTAITATSAMCSGTPDVTCTFTGLSSNTVYTYSITETSLIGSQVVPVTGYLVTKATAPGSPTITSAVASVATSAVSGNPVFTTTLTWAAPSSSGSSAISGYVASVTQTGLAGSDGVSGHALYCTSVLTASSTTCSFTVNSYTGANTVTFSVAAVNAAGSGTPATSIASATTADWVATVTPGLAGSSPAAVVPTLGNTALSLTYPALGSITVTWANFDASHTTNMNLSYPITGFVCDASLSGVLISEVIAGATATSCNFTGLLNKAYTIDVYAINGFGTTADDGTSAPTTVVSKVQVSNSPALFGAASVVSGTISVQWQAPITSTADSALGGANGSAIVSYTATATDSAGVVAGTCTGAATATLCTITGLKNSTTYDVVVTPTNSVGASTVVEHLAVKTIAASAAAAPSAVNAVRTAAGLSVSWTAPATAGSGQLVGYWVTATDVLTGQQNTCPYNATYGVLLAPSVSCNITGLTVGNSYNVSVTAITKDGAGAVQTSAAGTKVGVIYTTLAPEPVIATFLAVTAKQKSVSALSGTAKSGLNNLISSTNDGAKLTITGYGTTKAIALARANAAANYLFNNGAAVHVTIKTVISKTIKTSLVTVTSN